MITNSKISNGIINKIKTFHNLFKDWQLLIQTASVTRVVLINRSGLIYALLNSIDYY